MATTVSDSITDQGTVYRRFRRHAWLVIALCLAPTIVSAQDSDWPREIPLADGTALVYPPQVDSLARDVVFGRAAVSITRTGQTEPVFGAAWFTSRVVTDRDSGTVTFSDTHITRLRFPDLSDDQQRQLTSELDQGANALEFSESLARFTATVQAAQVAATNASDLSTTPPKIVLAQEPSVLVVYDGDPPLRPIEGTSFQRVVNTPFVVIYDPAVKTFYLAGGQHWYTATVALGPWTYTATPPAAVVELVPYDSLAAATDTGPPRKVLVVTEASELVVTIGPPNFVPLAGTDLLYISNTESDLFKDIGSQDYFILLAGRWYRSRRLEGPWVYVRVDRLPATFAKIPASSPKAEVLVSVAGTEQAADAAADATIPQTAAIKRSEVKLGVTYDGDPKFEIVQGTQMQYAVNASTAVLRIGRLYYGAGRAEPART